MDTDDFDDERDIILKKYFDRYLPGYYNDIELSKNNKPCMTYYDLDADAYRTAVGNLRVKYE